LKYVFVKNPISVIFTISFCISIKMSSPKPLTAGQKAPSFTYLEGGATGSSTELTTAYLVYFYPKDDTPGCTKQACGIRDIWADFRSAGLKVFGISKDSENSHDKFRAKYTLPFPLIADTELKLAQAFGVYGEKKFMGRVYDGVHRISFLVAADGTILKTYNPVKAESHATQVLKDLASIAPET
jgi:peroxiredoxin Q/BCP